MHTHADLSLPKNCEMGLLCHQMEVKGEGYLLEAHQMGKVKGKRYLIEVLFSSDGRGKGRTVSDASIAFSSDGGGKGWIAFSSDRGGKGRTVSDGGKRRTLS